MSNARGIADSDLSRLTVDSTTLVVDDTNNRVGIGTSSPAVKLHVSGAGSTEMRVTNTTASLNAVMAAGTSSMDFGTNTNHRIDFYTNSSLRATLDTSGNVGIGTSSPSARLHVSGTTDATQRIIVNGSGNYSSIKLQYNGTEVAQFQTYQNSEVSIGATASAPLILVTNNTERARIDSSGNLLVGTTSTTGVEAGNSANEGVVITSGGQILAQRDNDAALYLSKNSVAFPAILRFNVAGSNVGSVTVTTSSAAYNTSSDYRLKEDWVAVADASTRVNALKPVNFAWKVDGSRVDGFLAHELAEVVPEAVTGEKDAMRDEEYELTPAVEATYDEEGNELTPAVEAVMGTRSVPDYQGIDQSKLVPLLTAALQEALAKIEDLTARVAALE